MLQLSIIDVVVFLIFAAGIKDYAMITSSIQKMSNCYISVLQEFMITSAVVVDVAMCFFIGEVIGRRSLVGYNIPGAHL